jgi:Family of unknown function (DUF6152)
MTQQHDTGMRSRRGPAGPLRGLAVGAVAILIAVPCAAHYSVAMFDQTKPVTLHGTVKELQWVNPHCFLQMLIPTGNALTEWSIELQSPSSMYRIGWRPGTLQPGDKVTVVIAPTKDGTHGGSLMSATDVNGRALQTVKVRQ